MEDLSHHLRVGLLLGQQDFESLSEGKFSSMGESPAAICEALVSSPFVSEIFPVGIERISTPPAAPSKRDRNIRRSFDRFIGRACAQIENALYGSAGGAPIESSLPNERGDQLRAKLRHGCTLPQQRKQYWSETEVTEQLKNLDLDLLVRGSGLAIERGNVLSQGARFGVLSLHHGFNDLNRGGPVGFWEVYFGEVSGITAQILSPELDGGIVISQNMLRSADTPHLNRKRIYQYTGQVIQHAIARLARDKETVETDIYFRDILRAPKAGQRAKLSTRLLSRYAQNMSRAVVRKAVRGSRFHQDPSWRVFVSANPRVRFQKWREIHGDGALPTGDWIADPFAVSVDGRDYLLFEHWVLERGRGHIGFSEITSLSDIELTPPETLIKNDHHFSYPYTFQRGKRAYAMPENQRNGIHLYELIHDSDGQLVAKKRRCILNGYWVDPSVIRIDEVDYVFVSEGAQTSSLRLFTSPDITRDALTEHPMSPVIVDARTGRNSGRISLNEDGSITRPAQDCTTAYGARIHLCQHRVTPTDFDDLGIQRTLNAYGQIKSFHHYETYRGLTFHDCVEH